MELSRLYSNQDRLFEPIDFNCGERADTLNVIFARVTKPKDRKRHSHNLGKTTLIHLLDFMLLKDISGAIHFLSKHADRFERFVFYLELKLHSEGFVTVRRSVADPTSISLKRHEEEKSDLRIVGEDDWDHSDLPRTTAVDILDSYLNLQIVTPWNYRKGVSYFLRAQEDYQGYFQIQKFIRGKDRDWKPYVANVFGLDHQAVHRKYELDQEIEDKEKWRDEKRAEVQLDQQDRNELATKVEIRRDEITELVGRLDAFDFHQEERRISKHIVDEIERKVADINNALYNLDADISQIDSAISSGFKFDLKQVKTVFEETGMTLPDAVVRSYEELIDFNSRLTKERNHALRSRKRELEKERVDLSSEHEELDEQRGEYLKIIRDADTFRKYKALQTQLAEQRAELMFQVKQLERLDAVAEMEQQIRSLKQGQDLAIGEIEASLREGSPVKSAVTRYFNRYVKRVLDVNGVFSITQNRKGNIEFHIRTTDVAGNTSSQSEGSSYHRLLCALFDLAVLKSLEDAPFYHFVYHDGILEGLDDRVKINLMELIRESIADGKIQYMLSAIDSDLPLGDNERKIFFSDEEIILSLHDAGDDGRLFKMPPF